MTAARADIVFRRAVELDALDAILPFDRRDQLAALLTDDDVATLKHLAQQGMGDNTLRALASDLGYLEAWCQLATGAPLPWPAPEALLLKFVAQHLWDPVKRAEDPGHGMPAEVEAGLRAQGLLRADGPHAPEGSPPLVVELRVRAHHRDRHRADRTRCPRPGHRGAGGCSVTRGALGGRIAACRSAPVRTDRAPP